MDKANRSCHLIFSNSHLVHSNAKYGICSCAIYLLKQNRIAGMLNNQLLLEFRLLMPKSIWLINELWSNCGVAFPQNISIKQIIIHICDRVLISINPLDGPEVAVLFQVHINDTIFVQAPCMWCKTGPRHRPGCTPRSLWRAWSPQTPTHLMINPWISSMGWRPSLETLMDDY